MISKKRLFKYISIGFGFVAIPAITVAGFFVIGNSDRFRQFSVSPANDSNNGLISAYRAAVFSGAEVIMNPGFTHNIPIQEAVETEPEFFGGVGFLLFDDVVPAESPAALQTFNITFRVDLGSIQTGIATAYFLNQNQARFDVEGSEGLSYSLWGGLPFSSVVSFMGGFQTGIEWANENFKDKEIEQADESGTLVYQAVEQKMLTGGGATDFTNGFGPSDGIGTQQSIINLAADVVMPVAGPQVFTAQDLIERGNVASLLIGVDSAVEDDPRIKDISNQNLSGITEKNKLVLFSSLKDLAKSGEIALDLINNGNKLPEGANPNDPQYNGFLVPINEETSDETLVGGLGISSVGNSVNGSVGVSGIGVALAEEAMQLLPDDTIKPWLDPVYSQWDKMVYNGVNGSKHYYGDQIPGPNGQPVPNAFGLRLEPTLNIPASANYEQDVLNLQGFITEGAQSDANKVKIILSSANSILLDASFSQSCYLGLANFLYHQNINIPFPPGHSAPEGGN